jgi:hydroxymethylbilane synthase
MTPIPAERMLPSAGQGALALQCRRSDARSRQILARLNDPLSQQCVALERAVVLALQGDCTSPIAALAQPDSSSNGTITLQAAVGARSGEPPVIRACADGHVESLVATVVKELERQGARELLASRMREPAVNV